MWSRRYPRPHADDTQPRASAKRFSENTKRPEAETSAGAQNSFGLDAANRRVSGGICSECFALHCHAGNHRIASRNSASDRLPFSRYVLWRGDVTGWHRHLGRYSLSRLARATRNTRLGHVERRVHPTDGCTSTDVGQLPRTNVLSTCRLTVVLHTRESTSCSARSRDSGIEPSGSSPLRS